VIFFIKKQVAALKHACSYVVFSCSYDNSERLKNIILEYFFSHYRLVRMTVKSGSKYSDSDHTHYKFNGIITLLQNQSAYVIVEPHV
jgi:hypothetical protein